MPQNTQRIERGDWQTPHGLALTVATMLRDGGLRPAAVLEPTCGRGAFVAAARSAWPEVRVLGVEINPDHALEARAVSGAEIQIADAFEIDWSSLLGGLPDPLLVLGNPPWVTAAGLGALGSAVRPERANKAGVRGIDALTGQSNFDVSEWLLEALTEPLLGRPFTMAVLCKTIVARKLLVMAETRRWPVSGALRRINAKRHFGASVEACLLTLRGLDAPPTQWSWPVFDTLDAKRPSRHLGIVDGVLCSDAKAFERTRHLKGTCLPVWRSGLKHDCARVMEFKRDGGQLIARSGANIELEPLCVYPLLKGSDVANGRLDAPRAVLVPQRHLGDDPSRLKRDAPLTWAWLEAHGEALGARKSAIYKNQPPYAIFGVGDYAFAPWKIAIAGLYKRLRFELIGPRDGRPVMLDDTCYFLPFDRAADARRALKALRSKDVRDFLTARIFWDAKRPIKKAILQALDLSAAGGL